MFNGHNPSWDQKIKQFEELLGEKNLKLTKERRELLTGVLQEKDHFSIETLVHHLKQKGKKASRDTVYRNIPLLIEAGIVRTSFQNKRDTYYELADQVHHHDHILCRRCGRVEEFNSPTIEKIQDQITKKLGFKMEFHLHQLIGLCDKCQKGHRH